MAQGKVRQFCARVLIAILKAWTNCKCLKSVDAPSLKSRGHHHAHTLVTSSLQTPHSRLARRPATVFAVSLPARSSQLSSRRACCVQASVGQTIHLLCGPQSDEKASTRCLQTTLTVTPANTTLGNTRDPPAATRPSPTNTSLCDTRR